MGYAQVIGECGCCGRIFSFNPLRVPSNRFGGQDRQPVCSDCVMKINEIRRQNGLMPFSVAEDAYDTIDEQELGE